MIEELMQAEWFKYFEFISVVGGVFAMGFSLISSWYNRKNEKESRKHFEEQMKLYEQQMEYHKLQYSEVNIKYDKLQEKYMADMQFNHRLELQFRDDLNKQLLDINK